mgnify:CR=1 FL=1
MRVVSAFAARRFPGAPRLLRSRRLREALAGSAIEGQRIAQLAAGRIALTTYVPTDLLAQIDKIKEQRGVLGRAPIIEEALRFYIEAKQGT